MRQSKRTDIIVAPLAAFTSAAVFAMTLLLLGAPVRAADRFDSTSPLGLNLNDIPALNAMPEQKLLELGLLDVTKPPFQADPTGQKDSTKAIADAVIFGRYHKLAVWFPGGDYLVSDTIRCPGGWADFRTPNHKFLPYIELWGCALIGDQQGDKRARIILAEKAPGFNDPANPKPILDYRGSGYVRTKTDQPVEDDCEYTAHNHSLRGIDVQIRPGNPGAAAVKFAVAEGSTVQDCVFDVGEGYTGFLGGPGSGGAVFNVTIRGGAIGALLHTSRADCTMAGCSFEGQRESAVDCCHKGPLTLVGCEFRLPGGVPALRLPGAAGDKWNPAYRHPSASLVDCRIEYPKGDNSTTCVETAGALYLRDVWIENGGAICKSRQYDLVGELGNGWTRVSEMAVASDYKKPIIASVCVDGVKQDKPLLLLERGGQPPADLRSRHIWSEKEFPTWNSPAAVNAKSAYGAKGDGVTDDSEALQKAIDENEIVFLPRGAYRVGRTLQLKPDTKLIGVHSPYTILAPLAVEGGDFNDPSNPRPVLQTADTAEADTQIAWLYVFMPRELTRNAAYMLAWRCGGSSRMRCVFPLIGHTQCDFEPLAKKVYPWTNWSWDNFDFPDAVGLLIFAYGPHRRAKLFNDEFANPDHPIAVVTGHGGGWYPYMAVVCGPHGPGYRHILVTDCQGPFRLYPAHIQYARGGAQMEIINSHDVAIYGIKTESPCPVVKASNSSGLLITGLGGIAGSPCILLENCSDFVLANLINMTKFNNEGEVENTSPHIRVHWPDGTEFVSPPYERFAVFKSKKKQNDESGQ